MQDMAAFATEFETGDGLALPCRALFPDRGAPHAAVVIVHGLGDHSGSVSYVRLAEYLTKHGFACYLYDQRGYGRASGPRAYAPSFGHVRDDLRRFVLLVRDHAGAVPLFVIGLSLGGLIALDQAIHHPEPMSGVVAGAPALGEPQASRLLLAIAPLLSRATPHWRLDPGLDIANLSRDAEAVKAYINDPLFELRVSARLGAEIVRAMRATMNDAAKLRVPLLLQHGDADRITLPSGSREFQERAGSADKTLIIYPGALHDPLIDIECEHVLADIRDWLIERTPPPVASRASHAAVRT